MIKYVALLRGINVGGNKKVEMLKLKKVFDSLGFVNVSTYINSGNVIFQSDKKDFSNIEGVLEKTFGFKISVVIRNDKNIQNLYKKIPSNFKHDEKQKTDVLFLQNKFNNKKTIKLININSEVDNLQYVTGAIIWNIQKINYGKSGMRKFIGTEIYKNMTARNVNTVRKIAKIMSIK